MTQIFTVRRSRNACELPQNVESLLSAATAPHSRGRCRPGAIARAAASLFTILVCVLGCRAAALAQSDSAVLTALQDRYKALHVAMAAADDRRIVTVLAPDYVGIDLAGRRTGAKQMLEETASLPLDPHALLSSTLSSVRQTGDAIVVDQRFDIKTTEPNCGGVEEKIEYVAFSTDTWVDAGGTWLLQKSQTERLEYYVNGRQVADDVRPQ